MFGWDDLALLAASAYSSYAAGKKSEPTAPPAPSNYYNADGSFQVWNPRLNGYSSLGARTPTDELATNWGSRLIMNKMLGVGGYDSTRGNLDSEINALKSQYIPGGDARANAEIMQRIQDLTNTQANLKDVNLGYSPIGQTSATDLLKYQGATDTVHDYLTGTLDKGYKEATDMGAQVQAHRGMAQSTMSDWGRDEMAKNYALGKEGVAVQSEDYYRQLRAADEAAKTGILSAAQGGLGLDASLASGRNSASQAQESLAQQLASYNSNLQYNWSQAKDAWSNSQNQNLFQTLAGTAKMAAGGYVGGTAGVLGMNPSFWSTGWGGTNYNPNRGSSTTTSSSGTGSSWINGGKSNVWG